MAKYGDLHTTNYCNTFIAVAEDCPVSEAAVPPQKGQARTVANIHFDMIEQHPYEYTSDDVIFAAYAEKNNITKRDWVAARKTFFAKGQACLRCSPLGKRYGWGIHSNAEGKVAIYPVDSAEYKKLSEDKTLTQVKAMRSKRA